ncbi:MAG: UbiA prenyltransferase family protein [bacterium]|nr:UbiA prenyltransferase family protein [bacterium]
MINSVLANLMPYFHLLRLKGWKGYFFIVFLGFLLAKGFLNSFFDILVFFLTVALYLGFGFSINECFDVEEDKLNELKKNPVARREIDYKSAFIFSLALAFFGVFFSFYFGINYFLLYLAATILSFFYSAPPFRFKNRFLLDLVSHGLFAGLFLFFLPFFAFNSEIINAYYLLGLSVFCYSLIFEMKNQISDYESDKRAGLKTTACVFGLENSHKLDNFLFLIFPATLLPLFLSSDFLAIFLLIAFLFYLAIAVNKEKYKNLLNICLVSFFLLLLIERFVNFPQL